MPVGSKRKAADLHGIGALRGEGGGEGEGEEGGEGGKDEGEETEVHSFEIDPSQVREGREKWGGDTKREKRVELRAGMERSNRWYCRLPSAGTAIRAVAQGIVLPFWN